MTTAPAEGRRQNRIGIAVGAALVLAVVGYFAWSQMDGSVPQVDFTDTGYVVADEHVVEVSFQLTAAEAGPVECVLQAQDEQFGIVGWKVIALDAPAGASVRTERVLTVAEATTGIVKNCWVP